MALKKDSKSLNNEQDKSENDDVPLPEFKSSKNKTEIQSHRLEESKEINAKYHGDDKVKREDFYFFDMVKSFYTNGETMYKEYEKQRL